MLSKFFKNKKGLAHVRATIRRYDAMRKRLLPVLLTAILLFTACGDGITSGEDYYAELTGNHFKQVKDSEILYYDTETRIVYLIFQEVEHEGTRLAAGFGYMSPYYAPNGRPYRYIDGELREVGK